MGQLQILTQQQSPSGNPGTARANPNILAPQAEANRANARALSSIGNSVSRISNTITEFKEKQQQAKDQSATSTGRTNVVAGIKSMTNAFKDRNDFVNFVPEFQAKTKQLKKDATGNPFLSREAVNRLSVEIDNMITLANVDVEDLVSNKEIELMRESSNLVVETALKDHDLDLALREIHESHAVGHYSTSETATRVKDAHQSHKFYIVAEEIRNAAHETDQILAGTKGLSAANTEILSKAGHDQFNAERTAQVDEFTAFANQALVDNDSDINAVNQQIDAMIEVGHFTKTEGQKWKQRFAQDVVENTSVSNQRVMFTIKTRLNLDPNYTTEQAQGDLLDIMGGVTANDMAKFSSQLDVLKKQKEAGIKATTTNLHEKLRDAEKNGVFSHTVIDPEDPKKSIDQRKFLIDQIETRAAGLRDDIIFKNSRAGQLKLDQINQAERAQKVLVTETLDKPYNDAALAIEQYLEAHPDASIPETDAFWKQLMNRPLTIEAFRRAIQN